MSYLVMECHLGYAVVLDKNGRFIKVANLNYEIGQTVSSVMEIKEPESSRKTTSSTKQWIFSAVALAASLSIIVIGTWQFLLMPYGSVRMQINPDVLITVDRMDYVIDLEGLNEDGEDLINDYRFKWKKIDRVTDEMAEQAIDMGYLSDGGNIHLIVESEHENWKIATESRIILELEVYLGDTITVTTKDDSVDDEDIIIIPVEPGSSGTPADSSDDDDDEWEDDDDDQDMDDDNHIDDDDIENDDDGDNDEDDEDDGDDD